MRTRSLYAFICDGWPHLQNTHFYWFHLSLKSFADKRQGARCWFRIFADIYIHVYKLGIKTCCNEPPKTNYAPGTRLLLNRTSSRNIGIYIYTLDSCIISVYWERVYTLMRKLLLQIYAFSMRIDDLALSLKSHFLFHVMKFFFCFFFFKPTIREYTIFRNL